MLGRGLSLCVCRVGTNLSACLTRAATTRPPPPWGASTSTSISTDALRSVAKRRPYLTMSLAPRSTAAGGSGEKSGDVGSDQEFRERKKALRKRIKLELQAMSKSAVDTASAAVAERLLEAPELAAGSSSGAVSVYLSMPGELGTEAVVRELFKRGKKIYIPKVLGPASADMRMFPLGSQEEVDSFPLTKWKIPEPSEELVLSREDGVFAGDIDVVVVPGMAFDAGCNRLGHGKGYYDCFFERVKKSNAEKGRSPPLTLGVCFDEQVVDHVPTSATDVPLDFVLTPSRTLRRVAAGSP